MNSLIIVNQKNKIVVYDTWQSCHSLNPKLHRGFTVLVFNKKGELLLQKRSQKKPLWPGFWDGTSSHPQKGESFVQAAERRLEEEMGFTCKLKKTDQFQYREKYKNLGYEWEVCAVLEGRYDGKIKPNPDEVGNYKWISISKLKKEIKLKPNDFAPWFKTIINKIIKCLKE